MKLTMFMVIAAAIMFGGKWSGTFLVIDNAESNHQFQNPLPGLTNVDLTLDFGQATAYLTEGYGGPTRVVEVPWSGSIYNLYNIRIESVSGFGAGGIKLSR